MVALHFLTPEPTLSDTAPQPQPTPYLTPSTARTPDGDGTRPASALDTLLRQPTRLDLPSFLAGQAIVHTSTRPALMPYIDPLTSLASRLLFMPYHVLFPRATSAVHLTVPMAEDLVFAAKRSATGRLPQSLLLEVQAGQGIQVYDAQVTLVARLKGLRGFMYRWKLTAFVVFTGGFWVGEMVVLAGAMGLILAGILGGMGEGLGDDLDDDDYDDDELDEDGDEDGDERAGERQGGLKDDEAEIKSEPSSSPEATPSKGSGPTKSEEEDMEEDIENVPLFGPGPSQGARDEEPREQKVRDQGPEKQDVGVGTS